MTPPSKLRRPVKRGGDLFALYRWKPEQQQIIVGDGAGVARSNLL